MDNEDLSGARNLDQTGQHYMIDKVLINYIMLNAELEREDVVLEIGYGKGALTKELAKKCHVIAVDIEDNSSDIKNVTFVHANILKIFDELFEKYKFNKIVANIPYNISEPLMRLLFRVYDSMDMILLTMGKNFSDILLATDNRVGILVDHLFDIELLKVVKPRSFSPPPRVDSAIVKLESKVASAEILTDIYSKLVVLDDMKLKNAMEKVLPKKTKREVKEIVDRPLFEKKIYELSNKEFIELEEVLRDING